MNTSESPPVHPPALGKAPAVAHVAGCYVHGSENWIHTQVKHLRAHAPFVLTGQTKNHDQLDWTPPCYKTFGRTLPVRALDRVGKGVLGYRPSRRWYLHRHDAELVHAHFGPKGYETLLLAEAAGLPLVTTFYGHDLSRLPQKEPDWREKYQVLFKRGALFLVEGTHMKKRLVDLGCPREKVHVQHLGVELDRLSCQPRSRTSEEPLKILTAGRLTEKKGFPYAVRAFARFREQGGKGHLTIIGGLRDPERDQAARDTLNTIARRHGVEDEVRLRGFLPYEELLEAYYKHHVFLSPSVQAENGDNEGGAPVTLIEASATGMPIISTRHCDIPEVVQHQKTGLLAEEEDVEKLAEHLITLSRHPERLVEMGEEARSHIEREYNASIQGERLDEVYGEVRRGNESVQSIRPISYDE